MLQLADKPRDTIAWDRFLELGLPTRETEVYRYVRLKEIYGQLFHLPKQIVPHAEIQSGTLVFVNGAYCEALSRAPKPLLALPLSTAFKTYGNYLNSRLQKQLQEEGDPFAILNRAYFSEGLFL